ncbi:MAG TPA: EthD family reductase [Longimicrobium sp.]|jgi:uncharacterized protein (TIGR02118 family)|nr:EthD family reductase [Longimicrobium sp.]
MFKAMFFLFRRSDLSPEEFLRYGREVHVPIVSKVPGLERYVMRYTAMNPNGVEQACDAIAELWFASPESFQAALGSAEGTAALADQANFLDTSRTYPLIMEEETFL